MKENEKTKKRTGGISANLFAFPLLIVIAVLHIVLVIMIIDVNHSSSELSALMERSGDYQIDATNIQKANTTMSETSSAYIQSPTVNYGSLSAYANALYSDNYATKVSERFREYDVSKEVRDAVEKAADNSEKMTETQLHAISLVASVYELPPKIANRLPLPALTPEENAWSDDEKLATAKSMITESGYTQLRYFVNQYVDECSSTLREDFSSASSRTDEHVSTLRVLIWLDIVAIIVILLVTFILFYISIIRPLRSYSEDIAANRSIRHGGGVTEMRKLVSSFNGLLKARNKLETILRSAAENDALTGLPNRYCFERDLMKHEDVDTPMAVLLFDVNYLKRTNDTQGHLAGDQLIKTSAECIKECFGAGNANNCYRIGGDEFVALITDCDETEVKKRIDRFNLALRRESITVSVGYSFTDGSASSTFKEMMNEADNKMYEQKKHIHELNDNN